MGHYNPIFITSLSNCTAHTHIYRLHATIPWYRVCTVYCTVTVMVCTSCRLRTSAHPGTVTVSPQPPHQRVATLNQPIQTELSYWADSLCLGTFLLNFHRRLSYIHLRVFEVAKTAAKLAKDIYGVLDHRPIGNLVTVTSPALHAAGYYCYG